MLPHLLDTSSAGQSKLANILFTYELSRRLQPANSGSSTNNITVNALHPGVVRTELPRYLISDPDSLSAKLLTLLATPFTLSPEQVRCMQLCACSCVCVCSHLHNLHIAGSLFTHSTTCVSPK